MNKLLNRIIISIPLFMFYYLSFKNNYIYYFNGLFIILFSLLETFNLKKNKEIIIPMIIISSFLYFKINKYCILKIGGVIFTSDSLQLFFGKYFGQFFNYKPFPKISPNKTAIGYFSGITITLSINYYLNLFSFVNCLIILLSGIFGDLLFSYIKRCNKIKDFGIKLGSKTINILGEHGGILDRFDSLIGSLIFYFLGKIFIV